MTPVPYITETYQSSADGKFYGTVSYSGTVLSTASQGFKSAEAFQKWARSVASDHKAEISPAETHTVRRSFVL